MDSPQAAGGHLVECKRCHAMMLVTDGLNVHDGLDCRCCPSDTHSHAGPDGQTVGQVCRNVHIHINAVLLPLVGA